MVGFPPTEEELDSIDLMVELFRMVQGPEGDAIKHAEVKKFIQENTADPTFYTAALMIVQIKWGWNVDSIFPSRKRNS